MGKKKSKNYIDNKRFEALIIEYTNNDRTHEDELMEMFDKLIVNICESFKFKVDKEDAKQDCFLLILKTLKNFKPSKGSAFNFFTTIVVHNLKLVYTKNKRYNDKIARFYELKTGKPHNPSSV